MQNLFRLLAVLFRLHLVRFRYSVKVVYLIGQAGKYAVVIALRAGIADKMIYRTIAVILLATGEPVGDECALAHAALADNDQIARLFVCEKVVQPLKIFIIGDIYMAAAVQKGPLSQTLQFQIRQFRLRKQPVQQLREYPLYLFTQFLDRSVIIIRIAGIAAHRLSQRLLFRVDVAAAFL